MMPNNGNGNGNGKRPRGRPSLEPGIASTELSLTLPEPDYVEARQIAHAEGVSVQDVLRRAITRFLRDRRIPVTRGVVVHRTGL